MKGLKYILVGICLIMIIAIPVSALNVKQLTYDVAENGDAIVTADYDLSFVEKVGLTVPGIKDELTNAIKNEYGRDAEIKIVNYNHAEFTIPRFADNHDTYMELPSLNFTKIQEKIDSYWFIKVLDINYSPESTTIKIFNGKEFNYYNQMFIPSNVVEI